MVPSPAGPHHGSLPNLFLLLDHIPSFAYYFLALLPLPLGNLESVPSRGGHCPLLLPPDRALGCLLILLSWGRGFIRTGPRPLCPSSLQPQHRGQASVPSQARCIIQVSPPREGKGSIHSGKRGEEPPLTSSSLVWFWECGELGWKRADSGGAGAPAPQSTPPPERLHRSAATQPEVPTLRTLCFQATKAARVPHSLPGSCARPLSRVLATRHLECGSSQGIQGAIMCPFAHTRG